VPGDRRPGEGRAGDDQDDRREDRRRGPSLRGAAEAEHHEISVYQTLVTNANARGADEVARLPQQNLDQEQTTLEKVKTTEGIAVAV